MKKNLFGSPVSKQIESRTLREGGKEGGSTLRKAMSGKAGWRAANLGAMFLQGPHHFAVKSTITVLGPGTPFGTLPRSLHLIGL